MAQYPNGQRPKSALVRFRGCWATAETARHLRWAIEEYERLTGDTVELSEVYRFRGIPSDRPLGRARPDYSRVRETSTGDGNQEFQKGREDVGFTPSAATPGGSAHGDDDTGATDVDTSSISNMPLFVSLMRQAGFTRNIMPSEPWHFARYNAATVAIPHYDFASGDVTPIKEEYIMASRDEVREDMKNDIVKPIVDLLEVLLGTPAVQADLVKQINQAYQDTLGRQADPTGLLGFLSAMTKGMEISEVKNSLVNSAEYAGRWIQIHMYQGLLGRDASPEDIANWVQFWSSQGGNFGAVEAAIKGSPEYKQKHPNG